jgi:hypothetical protein
MTRLDRTLRWRGQGYAIHANCTEAQCATRGGSWSSSQGQYFDERQHLLAQVSDIGLLEGFELRLTPPNGA